MISKEEIKEIEESIENGVCSAITANRVITALNGMRKEIKQHQDQIRVGQNLADRLKKKVISMRTECNKRYSGMLQRIRKLEVEKMVQVQDSLFKEKEDG